MSSLARRNPDLAKSLIESKYPELIYSLISFMTEPSVVRLIEAGGNHKGRLVFNVEKGQVISFVPEMELKLGYEINK